MSKKRWSWKKQPDDYPSVGYTYRLRHGGEEYGYVEQYGRGSEQWYFCAHSPRTPPEFGNYNSLWKTRKDVPATGTLEWARQACLDYVKAALAAVPPGDVQ